MPDFRQPDNGVQIPLPVPPRSHKHGQFWFVVVALLLVIAGLATWYNTKVLQKKSISSNIQNQKVSIPSSVTITNFKQYDSGAVMDIFPTDLPGVATSSHTSKIISYNTVMVMKNGSTIPVTEWVMSFSFYSPLQDAINLYKFYFQKRGWKFQEGNYRGVVTLTPYQQSVGDGLTAAFSNSTSSTSTTMVSVVKMVPYLTNPKQ